MSAKKRVVKKKRKEFSKLLVRWALVITTVSVATSYLLSFFDHDPSTDVTVAVITSCIAIAVSYEAKSYGEKNSRNKYGINPDGTRVKTNDSDGAVG